MRRRAFSMVELLVVTLVIALLAACLTPVFASAKAASRKTICASRMRQTAAATFLYLTDYDDRFMPVSYRTPGGQGLSGDRTWAQLVLPYLRSFSLLRCPEDAEAPTMPATPDPDLVMGDADGRLYEASLRVNTGYNFQILAPVLKVLGADGSVGWTNVPRVHTELASASRTLLFLESAWTVDGRGRPREGGSWLVEPPCRWAAGSNGQATDLFDLGGVEVFTIGRGWRVRSTEAGNRFGGVYPWHGGRAAVAMADGSVRSLPTAELSRGCDVRDDWQGLVTSVREYPWSAR